MATAEIKIGQVDDVQELQRACLTTVPERYIRDGDDRPDGFKLCDYAQIPVVDVGELPHDGELNKLRLACEEWGFFQVVNHGIADELLDEMEKVTREFFHAAAGGEGEVPHGAGRHPGLRPRLRLLRGPEAGLVQHAGARRRPRLHQAAQALADKSGQLQGDAGEVLRRDQGPVPEAARAHHRDAGSCAGSVQRHVRRGGAGGADELLPAVPAAGAGAGAKRALRRERGHRAPAGHVLRRPSGDQGRRMGARPPHPARPRHQPRRHARGSD